MIEYTKDPARFIDDYIPINEKGEPWTLTACQRSLLTRVFRWGETRFLIHLLLWSEPKKSGKTFLAACLALWWAVTRPMTEVLSFANSTEQSMSRVGQTIKDLLGLNPELAALGVLEQSTDLELRFPNGTLIKIMPAKYQVVAGSRHSLAIFDELWAYTSENFRRLFEEATPPPGPENWTLIVTTAGFAGESDLLEELYKRGLAGQQPDPDMPLYQSQEFIMYWSHTGTLPDQNAEYYAQQKRLLRPAQYLRIHENRFVSPEDSFITAELWDACVDRMHLPLPPDKKTPVSIGIDASAGRREGADYTAITGTYWKGESPATAFHFVFKPPFSLADVQAKVELLFKQYRVVRILADPAEMSLMITNLRAKGIPVEEYTQNPANLMEMGQTLYNLLKFHRLIVYPDPELRTQALNTIALDSPRGWKVTKDRGSRKIDAVVSLMMSLVGALQWRPITDDEWETRYSEENRPDGGELETTVDHHQKTGEQRLQDIESHQWMEFCICDKEHGGYENGQSTIEGIRSRANGDPLRYGLGLYRWMVYIYGDGKDMDDETVIFEAGNDDRLVSRPRPWDAEPVPEVGEESRDTRQRLLDARARR